MSFGDDRIAALLDLICVESEIHGDPRTGGYVSREDLPPTWPRLAPWRAICIEARALRGRSALPKDGTHQTNVKTPVPEALPRDGTQQQPV